MIRKFAEIVPTELKGNSADIEKDGVLAWIRPVFDEERVSRH